MPDAPQPPKEVINPVITTIPEQPQTLPTIDHPQMTETQTRLY